MDSPIFDSVSLAIGFATLTWLGTVMIDSLKRRIMAQSSLGFCASSFMLYIVNELELFGGKNIANNCYLAAYWAWLLAVNAFSAWYNNREIERGIKEMEQWRKDNGLPSPPRHRDRSARSTS